MNSPSKKVANHTEGSNSATKSLDASLYKNVSGKAEEFLAGLKWQQQASQSIPSLLNQFKLRIDDDINVEFGDTFSKIMHSLDKEVSAVIKSKLSELETALKSLKSNEHSRICCDGEQYLRIVNNLELVPGHKVTLSSAINSMTLLGSETLVAGGGPKKLWQVGGLSSGQPTAATVFFEKSSAGECKHLLTDGHNRVVSAWDDGTVIVHQGSLPAYTPRVV